jgi:hypothetical protein
MHLKKTLLLLGHKPDDALFWLLWLIHLMPIWIFTPFSTVDGPAHLHNARILLELWQGNADMAEYYSINPVMQPNMLAHILLAAIMAVGIPALLAEKLLLSLIVALMPLAFRRFVKAYTNNSGEMVLLVFPFVYGFLFFMGFYNFLLGIVLGLFGLSLWIKLIGKSSHPLTPAFIVVTGLMTLLAHLYAFAWYAVFSGFVLFSRIPLSKSIGTSANAIWTMVMIWVLPLLPALYAVSFGEFSGGESYRLSFVSLWRIIYEVQPAKGLDYGKASIYTQWLFWLLAFRLLLAVYRAFKGDRSSGGKGVLAGFLLLTIALFVLPDGNALAGVVSQRTGLMWFLALLLMLAGFRTQIWMRWLSRTVAVVVSVSLLLLYAQELNKNQPVARSVALAARNVPAGAVVYVENASENMLHTHVSSYLGITKGVVISENYQAALPYFPIRWNVRNLPVLHLGEMSKTVKAWPVASGLRNMQADYVLVITQGNVVPELAGSLAYQHHFKDLYKLIYQDDKKTTSLYCRLPISIFDL